MDAFQNTMNVVFDALKRERANYHLTLGQLAAVCEQHPDAEVVTDTTGGNGDSPFGDTIGRENSYRGYYDDLAFAPAVYGETPRLGRDVFEQCQRAMTETYTGWKGGDYRYDAGTPLWLAQYGDCGPAIIDARFNPARNAIVLTTKDIYL